MSPEGPSLFRAEVPHHGQIRPECPSACLLAVLSRKCFNLLSRAYGAPFYPPGTVGDVLELYKRNRLREIGGIGARHASEIETALVLAGLDLADGPQRSDDRLRTKWAHETAAADEADIACGVRPDELLHLIADGLTAAGLLVRLPDRDEDCQLAIGCARGQCTLTAGAHGLVAWKYSPLPGTTADPRLIAGLAVTLLSGQASDVPRQLDAPEGEPSLTLKGIVGRELNARGLNVALEVYEDHERFDVQSSIVVINPAAAHPATVQVGDDGSVAWSCDYWEVPVTPGRDSEDRVLAVSPADVAGDVVATVTAAMFHVLAAAAEAKP